MGMGSQYQTKEALERRYMELCEQGDFGDELLEIMDRLDNWVDDINVNESEQTNTHSDHSEDEESTLNNEEVIQYLIKDYRIRLNEFAEDTLNLCILYDAVLQRGLTDVDFKTIVSEIIQQAKERYDCYIMPKESMYHNKQTQDVWDWIEGDSIIFSRQPLYMDIHKCQVDLSKYSLHTMGIGYVNYLALWTHIGCKFVMSA